MEVPFFVTYNLYESIPQEVKQRWEEEYEAEKKKILKTSKQIKHDMEVLGKRDFAKKDAFLIHIRVEIII